MASYGGPVYSPRVQDKSADYIYQGAADLWGGIGKGLSAGIAKGVDERQKSKALQSRFDMLADQGYATPELRDKFYKGSTSQQAGIMAELMATMDRDAAAGKEREAARRFDLGYGLDAQRMNQQADQFGQRMRLDQMQAGQDAAYRNATLEQNQQELEARNRPVTWEQLNGTNYMVNPRGGALPLSGGGEDDNPLGKLFNLPGARVTSYGYANDPTPDSNSAAGIGAFVPEAEQAKIKAGQPSPYRLQPGDFAVSPDMEARMRKAGVNPGDRVMFQRADGTTEAGRWMDRTSPKLSGRVDFYSPEGVRADDGAAITGFSLYAPAEKPAAPKAPPRVQTATMRDAEGNEQLVQLLPDGTYRPLRPAPAPAAAPGGPAAAAPAPSSALDVMRAAISAARR